MADTVELEEVNSGFSSSDSTSSSESDFSADISDELNSDPDSEKEHRDFQGRIVPYMYEPVVESGDDDGEHEIPGVHNDNDDLEERFGNHNWCSCGGCGIMPTVRESVCCKEIDPVVHMMDVFVLDLDCITEHPGLQAVCLDRWVLDTAYLQYRQQYGQEAQEGTENQKYRHTAYRQMARWCWGYLGRNVRVPLPSCVVLKIREKFPSLSGTYKGFLEI